MVFVTMLVSAMLYDFWNRLPPADGYSLSQRVQLYLVNTLLYYFGMFSVWSIERQTRHYRTVQEDFLMTLLKTNQDTLFGNYHNFRLIHSREKYTQRVPLSTHAYFQRYIEQVAKGVKSVLTSDDPIAMVVTSGTTGTGAKMLCCTKSILSFGMSLNSLMKYTMEKYNRQFSELRKNAALLLENRVRTDRRRSSG